VRFPAASVTDCQPCEQRAGGARKPLGIRIARLEIGRNHDKRIDVFSEFVIEHRGGERRTCAGTNDNDLVTDCRTRRQCVGCVLQPILGTDPRQWLLGEAVPGQTGFIQVGIQQ
jgi:hypothetical protein